MIFENAWRSVRRRTGYSLLLVIVFTVITAAVVVSLAIMQAAQTAKASGLANQSVTATISMNRSQIIKDAAGSASSDSSDGDSSNGDSSAREAARTAMNDMQLTLADYETYATAAGSLLTGTYYSQTAELTAVEGQAEPVSSSSSSSDAASSSSSDSSGSDSAQSGQPSDDGQGFGGRGAESPMSSSDFTVVGLSNDEALANLGITVSSGEAVATGTSDTLDAANSDGSYDAMVTDEFAQLNGLSVGDTFVVADSAGTQITFTVVGTYTSTGADSGGSFGPGGFGQSTSDRIIVSMATMSALGLDTDSNDSTQISYTYVLGSGSDYDAFVQACADAGLSDSYQVQSSDVDSYEKSIEPLLNLSKFAKTLLCVVLALGAVMLVAMTLFSIRTRTYEMGVMTAMGMHKRTVAGQMVVETIIVAVLGLLIGTCVGAAASVPVSNKLLASEISSAQSQAQQQQSNFGRQLQGGHAAGAQGASSGTVSSDATASSDASASSGASVPPDDSAADGNRKGGPMGQVTQYMSSVNASVNLTTVGLAALAILALALIAGLVGVIWVLRYEPLQILADRS
ncbi:ABC transporter permease [Pseudoscardovia suis]|uniref:ABC transporter permease n=1 Tax=Pseudoscardovia suis TaxID=987063 RepID=A0A261F116_9BIFI|nr:ABC transporter permease [Pseudoscardovia suis]OZG52810.1 ABC transporter permease [Pseudoscardovia suis]PJJ68314.1 putative ABC transport system permease protein [Pseudoscardovia suis]